MTDEAVSRRRENAAFFLRILAFVLIFTLISCAVLYVLTPKYDYGPGSMMNLPLQPRNTIDVLAGRIFTDFGAGMTRNFPLGMQDGAVAIIAVLLMLLVDILCEKQPDLRKKLAVSPLYVRWTLLMGLMFLTLIFGCYGAGFDRAAFLYAGF